MDVSMGDFCSNINYGWETILKIFEWALYIENLMEQFMGVEGPSKYKASSYTRHQGPLRPISIPDRFGEADKKTPAYTFHSYILWWKSLFLTNPTYKCHFLSPLFWKICKLQNVLVYIKLTAPTVNHILLGKPGQGI